MNNAEPKWFLLCAGQSYEGYDHIASFATREDAEGAVQSAQTTPYEFMILGNQYDFFFIVDLHQYVFGETNHEAGCHVISR
jgi:hypothetical protein